MNQTTKKKKSQRINIGTDSVFLKVLKFLWQDPHVVQCYKYLIPAFLITTGVIVLLMTFEVRLPKEGSQAEKSYYALNDFRYIDPELTRIERQAVADMVVPVFDYNQDLSTRLIEDATRIFQSLQSDNVEQALTVLDWPGARGSYENFVINATDKKLVLDETLAILRRYLDRYLIQQYEFDRLEHDDVEMVHVRKKDRENSVRLRDLVVIDSDDMRKSLQDNISYFLPDAKRSRVYLFDICLHLLSRPTVTFNAEETARRRKAKMDQVEAVSKLVKKGTLIIEKGETVRGIDLIMLKAMARDIIELNKNQKIISILIIFVISFCLFCTLICAFCRSGEVFTPQFLIVLGIAYLCSHIAIKLTYYLPSPVFSVALMIPISVVVLFFSSLGEPLVGVFLGFILCMNISPVYAPTHIPLERYAMGAFFAVMVARDIKRRSQLLRAGFFIGLIYCLIFFLFDVIFDAHDLMVSFREAFFMVVGGVIAALCVMGGLPLFEHYFHLSTNMHLLELSDMNHPLLRRLLEVAPGTYHHSLMVGALSEAAANAVGANAILARVGAYYHDIGKMVNPSYFTENQKGGLGKHENLTPQMSRLVVVAHVKDGVEIGKKYKLTNRIIDIIQQHHGTSLVSYFYHKALEIREDQNEPVEDYNFRYPGPKPQTKEAAIVMIADSSEAASRTLEDPTSSRIRGLVEKIVNGKIMDHQFDECAISFRDIHKITESLIASLNGMFHLRIDYQHAEKNKTKEAPAKTEDTDSQPPKSGASS